MRRTKLWCAETGVTARYAALVWIPSPGGEGQDEGGPRTVIAVPRSRHQNSPHRLRCPATGHRGETNAFRGRTFSVCGAPGAIRGRTFDVRGTPRAIRGRIFGDCGTRCGLC